MFISDVWYKATCQHFCCKVFIFAVWSKTSSKQLLLKMFYFWNIKQYWEGTCFCCKKLFSYVCGKLRQVQTLAVETGNNFGCKSFISAVSSVAGKTHAFVIKFYFLIFAANLGKYKLWLQSREQQWQLKFYFCSFKQCWQSTCFCNKILFSYSCSKLRPVETLAIKQGTTVAVKVWFLQCWASCMPPGPHPGSLGSPQALGPWYRQGTSSRHPRQVCEFLSTSLRDFSRLGCEGNRNNKHGFKLNCNEIFTKKDKKIMLGWWFEMIGFWCFAPVLQAKQVQRIKRHLVMDGNTVDNTFSMNRVFNFVDILVFSVFC